jgi:hypothetical protein
MTAEQISRAHRQAPFKPFTLFLSDQRRFEIRHPDFLWVIPGGRLVGVADDAGAVELIDLLHITALRLSGTEGISA